MERYRLHKQVKGPRDLDFTKTKEDFSSYEDAYNKMYGYLKKGFDNTLQIYSLYRWSRVENDLKEKGSSSLSDMFFIGKTFGYYKGYDLTENIFKIEKVDEVKEAKIIQIKERENSACRILGIICIIIGFILMFTAKSRVDFGGTPVSFFLDCIPITLGFLIWCLGKEE